MNERRYVTIETPAQVNSRSGNRTTAERWRTILESLGHHVTVTTGYDGAPTDLLVAIHACRSAGAVATFKSAFPARPVIVCLSGTDVYDFQDREPGVTHGSMEAANALVGLHSLVSRAIPARFHGKLHIIYQSAPAVARQASDARVFDVCVIGHLRSVKDPLRTALAARLLPQSSKIRVTHVGSAMDHSWAQQARAEMAVNPRYRWLGDVPAGDVRDLLAGTRLMVLSSTMEGGANVLGEAIAAGVPVIASAIDGSLGLLGEDYPGTYPTGDTQALATLLSRAESDPAFMAQLTAACAARAPLFAPERERQAWATLMRAVYFDVA
jgi:putative glycosyltransferase (TIGR04348 family)